MSPRLKKARKVLEAPTIKGFKPYGPDSDSQLTPPVNLLFEEYEALRLSDYDKLNHHQASELMQISRPTFTRIYASALGKIATAFVEGRQIAIEGVKVYYDSSWYHCNRCYCYFNNPDKSIEITDCALCGQQDVSRFDSDESEMTWNRNKDICICPSCQYEVTHQPGQPCGRQVCPRCHARMRRKRMHL